MRFNGEFICDGCGRAFTIELGPQQMAEWKTPKKRAEQIGQLALMLGRSCHECETSHASPAPAA